MISKFKPKSEFSKNVLTLMTGTTIAQAIPIAISPILTRIYTPEDFGKYALFLSLVMIAMSITTLRYEQAFMLPAKSKDAFALLKGSMIILPLMTVILTLLLIAFNNITKFDTWMIVGFSISIFFFGFVNIILAYFNRIKKYKLITNNMIITSVTNGIMSILFGLISGTYVVLIFSIIFSKIIAFFSLYKQVLIYIKIKVDKSTIISQLKEYKDMPKYSTPEVFIGTFNQQSTIIFLTYFFDPMLAGSYFLINRIFATPISVFSSSFSKVFYKEFTKSKIKKSYIITTWVKLFIIVVPLGILLSFILYDLIIFAFGANWDKAAIIAQILLPYFVINFVFSATSTSHLTLRLQHISLFFAILSLFVKLGIFIYGYIINDFLSMLQIIVVYDVVQIIFMNLIALLKLRKDKS
ncbi:lipopolysaccharide biosynthesis protein [Aliarcobacter butzleri]|uniref:lipopolysaccharide biosynthesis protein n=1 Tax=Aliarcobacter butzleri TaxID=28197 RepID=UPI002B244DAB|nr:oligosaccharide flippase family protein [Aliarcobacter butzleri]